MAETTEKTCPICGKPVEAKSYPFCSSRCADVDLGRWLSERYVVQTDEPAQEDVGIDS